MFPSYKIEKSWLQYVTFMAFVTTDGGNLLVKAQISFADPFCPAPGVLTFSIGTTLSSSLLIPDVVAMWILADHVTKDY